MVAGQADSPSSEISFPANSKIDKRDREGDRVERRQENKCRDEQDACAHHHLIVPARLQKIIMSVMWCPAIDCCESVGSKLAILALLLV